MDLKIGTHEETMSRIGMREFRRWMAWYELEERDEEARAREVQGG